MNENKNTGKWVVIVDDEALSLTNAKNMLAEQGIRVNCLLSGKDFLKFIKKNEPDLILLDVMMPEMDGFETLRLLREFEASAGRKPIPVIFLTGEKNTETEERGLQEGASDFIRKPFHQDILLRRIQNTIENSTIIESLSEEAAKDKLTGFLNKAKGMEIIGKLCSSKSGALMILDLDNFKLVNDIYGHDMGDRVLQAFSEIVKNSTRADDVVSRIGGDEFLAFFCNLTDEPSIAALTKRLNEALVQKSKELMGNDFDIPIGISTGVALAPEHSSDYACLFQYADSSLYKVKKNGKHGYALYSRQNDDEENTENLEADIQRLFKICGERNDGDEALLLGQDAFSWVYRFVMHLAKHYHGNATKLLFLLVKKDSAADMERAASQFAELLQSAFRKNDIILQSRPNQFFVVRPELTGESSAKAIEQILSSWAQTQHHDNIEIRYAAEKVSFAEEKEK